MVLFLNVAESLPAGHISLPHTPRMYELLIGGWVYLYICVCARSALASHRAAVCVASAETHTRSWRHLALIREQICEPPGRRWQSVHPVPRKHLHWPKWFIVAHKHRNTNTWFCDLLLFCSVPYVCGCVSARSALSPACIFGHSLASCWIFNVTDNCGVGCCQRGLTCATVSWACDRSTWRRPSMCVYVCAS